MQLLATTAVREDPRIRVRRMQLAAALLVLNLADVVLTRAVIDRGGVEVNPIMRGLMDGFAAPLGLKAVLAGVAGTLLLLCPDRSRLADPAAYLVAGGYAFVVLWNAGLLAWLTLA